MNDDTVKLLKECNVGCKIACDNISQVYDHIYDPAMKGLFRDYYGKHAGFNEQSGKMLMENGEKEKYPSSATRLLGTVTVGVKLTLSETPSTVSKLMIDGCSMGIKSVGENLNKYKNADPESQNLARDIITTERKFMDDVIQYL